ncbi:MAG: SMP-30/gluconolactonase/LRE family protein [Spirochaetales bacterium]|nr:MAG: SMP-30/gluconolactonase/LRE family protein [Spirochaetales bacterium]
MRAARTRRRSACHTGAPEARMTTGGDSLKVVVEHKAELGEGAFWDIERKVLIWLDILRGEVHQYDPETGIDRYVTVPGHCGTVVTRNTGGLVLAMPDQVAAINPNWEDARRTGDAHTGPADHTPSELAEPEGESITTLCDLETDIPENRANDGKCDPRGRLWVGSISDKPSRGALYRVDCDHSVTRMVSQVSVSNGICWDESRQAMYYVDTPTMRVDRFDFDVDSGTISNRTPFIQVPKGMGAPDGMTIDANGDLWVAMWGGSAVTHWDGVTGALKATFDIPVERVTSCAFAGPNLETLYVTTAAVEVTPQEFKRQPLAGSLFSLNPGVNGLPMVGYCG